MKMMMLLWPSWRGGKKQKPWRKMLTWFRSAGPPWPAATARDSPPLLAMPAIMPALCPAFRLSGLDCDAVLVIAARKDSKSCDEL